jgi:hypothetical protein
LEVSIVAHREVVEPSGEASEPEARRCLRANQCALVQKGEQGLAPAFQTSPRLRI